MQGDVILLTELLKQAYAEIAEQRKTIERLNAGEAED